MVFGCPKVDLPKAELAAGAPNAPVAELFPNVDGVDVEPKTGAEGIDDDDTLLKADEVEGKVDVKDAAFFKSLL